MLGIKMASTAGFTIVQKRANARAEILVRM
jgi:hypothetical protein